MTEESPRLFDRYALLDLMDERGPFQTWRAVRADREHPDALALQLASEAWSARSGFEKLLIQSAELGRRFTHPGTTKVQAWGRAEGRLFLVLDLHEGRSLAELKSGLAARGLPLPPTMAALIARDLADAVAWTHQQVDEVGDPLRLVHQDLSPHTVRLGRDGRVRIFQAGPVRSASLLDPELERGTWGEVGWKAPERVKGAAPTPRTDVWAIGVLLWELLAGRPMWSGDTEEEVMADILAMPAADLTRLRPELPAELVSLVNRATDKRMLNRTGSAEELRDQLDAWLGAAPEHQLRSAMQALLEQVFADDLEIERERIRALVAARPRLDSPASEEQSRLARRLARIRAAKEAPPPEPEPPPPPPPRALPRMAISLVVGLLLAAAGWTLGPLRSPDPPAQEVVQAIARQWPHPGTRDARLLAGRAGLADGRPGGLARAQVELEQAVAADPWSAEAAVLLARAWRINGVRADDAAALQARAEALEPGVGARLTAELGPE